MSAHRSSLIIIVAGALLFIPFLGNAHLFDWDEINFAECAREMIVSGDYFRVQINFERFWEKPPLFIWMQAISMHLFGVGNFASRFPNAIIGIATLLALFHIGRREKDGYFGFLWVLMYIGSILPHFYFKSGIIDPTFNLFIFLGVYYLYRAVKEPQQSVRSMSMSGLFIGLAVMTKGPVGFLLVFLSLLTWWVWHRKQVFTVAGGAIWAGVMILVSMGWYGVDLFTNGIWFIGEFLQYQIRLLTTEDAGHGGPIFYHVVVLLVGCFPASIFAAAALFKGDRGDQFRRWMRILFWVVLILFSLVQSKIVHYSSMCYFPLTFLAADYLHGLEAGDRRRGLAWMAGVVGVILGIAFTALPVIGKNPDMIIPLIKDPFAVQNLAADVTWSGFEILIGAAFLGILLASLVTWKKALPQAAMLLLLGTLLTTQALLIVVVPKIEGYSQRAAIEFYKEQAGQDVYVEVLHYKSYAHLFYFQKPGPSPMSKEEMLNGNPDKLLWVVTRSDRLKGDEQERYGLVEHHRKNGFVFLKKEPQ
jgi:4-amino-4-deoxy-L-arabinose transferase-like glycosyltransferase